MGKHTPGPWKVTEDARVFSESAREWNRTFNANTPAFIAACSGNAANARLIAAAPDLLAAAEALLGHRFYRASGLSDSHAELLGALRAAIAAAKGEE